MRKAFLSILLALALAVPAWAAIPPSPPAPVKGLKVYTVGTLPSASANTNLAVIVSDGASAGDCTVGSGTTRNVCISTGAAWAAVGDGTGGEASISDAAFGAGWNGDTTHAPSKNAIYDAFGGWAGVNATNPSFASVTATGANGIIAGVAGTTMGKLTLYSNTPANVFYFSLYTGNFTENVGWRVPTAQPGGSNYLLNIDADGTMDYTNPATFQAAMTAASQAEMEAGTEAALRSMSPARVKQAILALAPAGTWGSITGTLANQTDLNTALAGKAATTGDANIATVGTITTGTWTATRVAKGYVATDLDAGNLASNLAFEDGTQLDLSGITLTGGVDEGIAIPNWVNVVPASDKNWITVDRSANAIKFYNGGWVSVGATAAPTDAGYLTTTANATLSAESNLGALTTGLLKITVNAGVATPSTAASGTDYAPATSGTAILKGNNSGGFANAVAGTDYLAPAGIGVSVQAYDADLAALAAGITGLVKGSGNGGGYAAAVAGTDYLAPAAIGVTVQGYDADLASIAGGITGIVKGAGNGGGFSAAVAGTDYPGLASANTWTGNQVYGDADTDTVTFRSMLLGGNSREIQINAGARVAPTYPSASPTQDLYIRGNLEVAGTVYGTSFIATGTGESYIALNNNASGRTPAAGEYSIYFETDGTNKIRYALNGSEKTAAMLEDAQTFTGAKTFSAATAIQAALTLSNGASAAQLIMQEASGGGTETITIQTGNITTGYTVTLPTAQGANNTTLINNGSGVLSWGVPTAGAHGSDTYVQFNDGGAALGSDGGFTFNKTTQRLLVGKNGTGGGLVLYNELGGTDYNATIIPNAAQAAAATITLPAATGTLATLGNAETFTGAKSFSSSILPATNDGAGLGSASYQWSDLFLASGAVINFNNGNATLTHSAGLLTFSTSIGLANGELIKNGTNGRIDLAGAGGTNNEDLTFDFETTANQVDIGSTTGVDTLKLVQGIALNANMRPSVTKSGNATLTQAEMNGTIYVNGAYTMTLPEVVASSPTSSQVTPGASVCIGSVAASVIRLNPHNNDGIRLNMGTRQSNGVDIYSAGAIGDFICAEADSASGWTTWGRAGTWTQGS